MISAKYVRVSAHLEDATPDLLDAYSRHRRLVGWRARLAGAGARRLVPSLRAP